VRYAAFANPFIVISIGDPPRDYSNAPAGGAAPGKSGVAPLYFGAAA